MLTLFPTFSPFFITQFRFPSPHPPLSHSSQTLHLNPKSSSNFPPFSCNSSSISINSSDSVDFSNSLKNPVVSSFDCRLLNKWVDPDELVAWVQSCCTLKEVKIVHAVILKCLVGSNVYVSNNLLCSYVSFGELDDAGKVFDEMPERNVVSWTAMLNGYLKFDLNDEGFRVLGEFVKEGVRGNAKTFVCILNLCCRRLDYQLGRQIHACIVKGNLWNLIIDSSILFFYSQFGDLLSAFRVFDGMEERDVVSWTTIITACSQQGLGYQAFSMFLKMILDGYFPNEHTVCSVLKACGEEKVLKFGRQLHVLVVKKLIRNDIFVGTSLIDMYARCGEIIDSTSLFERMRKRNLVTWTSMITGYARNGCGYEALDLFRVMKRRNIIGNNLTLVSILRACGSIKAILTGKELHAQVIKNCLENNIYIGSTLVWLYCKCGEYILASKVLQEMPLRDVVSWTAIISGYSGLGYELEALEFLKKMLGEGVEPNPFTYSSVLKACASLEAIEHGKLIHSSLNKNPAFSNVFVGSSLINMYAKCGYVKEAFQVFSSMPERNLVSWRSMIVGYAKNGHCSEALKLMYRMQEEGFEVDDYVFTTVLSACGDVEWSMGPSSKHLMGPC